MCELKCTEPLAKTEDAVHFAGLMESGRFSATCLLFFSPINFFELSLGQEMDFLSTSHSNFDPYISAVDVL